MKKSHSSGPDGITSAKLKPTIRAISPVLSLMQGVLDKIRGVDTDFPT